MKIIEHLITRYKSWRFKKNLRHKIDRLNNPGNAGKSGSARMAYPEKIIQKSAHDSAIKAYLAKHQSRIQGIGTGWYPYLYEMIDELIENGLQPDDEIWAKEKYGEFRCHVAAKDQRNQAVYNKIVGTYTNIINTVCQFCDSKGVSQTIDSWEYNLCLQHYLETRYQIDVDNDIRNYKKYFGAVADQSTYKHIASNTYYRLDELAFRKRAELLYALLKEKCPSDDNSIRYMMLQYFGEESFLSIELEDQHYRSELRFVDTGDNVIDKPGADYYNRFEAYEDIIEEICR